MTIPIIPQGPWVGCHPWTSRAAQNISWDALARMIMTILHLLSKTDKLISLTLCSRNFSNNSTFRKNMQNLHAPYRSRRKFCATTFWKFKHPTPVSVWQFKNPYPKWTGNEPPRSKLTRNHQVEETPCTRKRNKSHWHNSSCNGAVKKKSSAGTWRTS